MSERTRTCRECQRPYPMNGIYFHLVSSGAFDTVCMDCRERHGRRSWDVQHDNRAVQPDGYDAPKVEVFPDGYEEF